MTKRETILITGSSGYIGTKLCHKLINSGLSVYGIDIKPGEFTNHICDITDVGKLEKIIIKSKCTSIVNLAAITDTKNFNPKLFNVNAYCLKSFLDISVKYGCKQFIHFSSMLSDLGTSFDPNKESKDYGDSKLMSEKIVNNYQDIIKISILRPTSVYGGVMIPYHMRKFQVFARLFYFFTSRNTQAKKSAVSLNNVCKDTLYVLTSRIEGTFYLTDPFLMSMEDITKKITGKEFLRVRILISSILIKSLKIFGKKGEKIIIQFYNSGLTYDFRNKSISNYRLQQQR
jgi:nucleoside-diphosphate-sugar epimerase